MSVAYIEGTPRVRATREGDQLTFKCEKCGEKHYHSLGNGHRTAHCNGWESGYFLEEEV